MLYLTCYVLTVKSASDKRLVQDRERFSFIHVHTARFPSASSIKTTPRSSSTALAGNWKDEIIVRGTIDFVKCKWNLIPPLPYLSSANRYHAPFKLFLQKTRVNWQDKQGKKIQYMDQIFPREMSLWRTLPYDILSCLSQGRFKCKKDKRGKKHSGRFVLIGMTQQRNEKCGTSIPTDKLKEQWLMVNAATVSMTYMIIM